MENKEKPNKKKNYGLAFILLIIGLFFGFSALSSNDSSKESNNQVYQPNQQAQQCNSNWSCSDWNDCESGTQTRACMDSNNCGTDSNKPPTTQSCILNKGWQDVKTFQSSSSKKTETFMIKGEKWRFTWSCKKLNSYDAMNIGVYEPDNEAYTEFLFLQKCPNSEETTYVYKGNAEYYFDIQIANIDSWKIKVEDWY
ncbi:MAG: hypothetical protein AABW89_05730 [Nanoarchaeota archaeon]